GVSLPAALDIALDEFLCIFLEDLVDLVEQVVEILLDLLALLGQLTTPRAGLFALRGFGRPCLLPLLFSHGRSPPGPREPSRPTPKRRQGLSSPYRLGYRGFAPLPQSIARVPRRSEARCPAGPGTSPAGPRRRSGRPHPIGKTKPGRSPRWRRSWRAAA